MNEFNQEILETMQKQVANIKSVYEVCDYCKKGNELANEEYLKKYPTHRELLSIFERSITILESNIINEYNEYIVENTLSDIEFLISQNVLTESHIRRLLLGPITIQDLPIFKRKVEDIKERLISIYNCESSRFYYKFDEFKAAMPFNYQQLCSYFRYNKVGYEEELVNNEHNGDYVIEHFNFDINCDVIDKINRQYPQLENINIIDKFRLEQHGLKPITECNDCFIHQKNDKQYNLFKQDGNYYMITETSRGFKSYKITVHDKSIDLVVESLYTKRK